MKRTIEHEVIASLAEHDVNLTMNTSRDGYKISCITDPKDYDKAYFIDMVMIDKGEADDGHLGTGNR